MRLARFSYFPKTKISIWQSFARLHDASRPTARSYASTRSARDGGRRRRVLLGRARAAGGVPAVGGCIAPARRMSSASADAAAPAAQQKSDGTRPRTASWRSRSLSLAAVSS